MNPLREINYRMRWLFGWIPHRMENKEMDVDLAEFVLWHATNKGDMGMQMTMVSELLRLKTTYE